MAKDEVKKETPREETPKEESKKKVSFNEINKGPTIMLDTSKDPKIG